MLKKAKIVMFATEKANLILINDRLISFKGKFNSNISFTYQHLYITTDDEIQEGDWFYSSSTKSIESLDGDELPLTSDRKIIATTDSSLINTFDRVTFKHAQPSQSFIEKYVEMYNKGQQITDVMIEFIGICNNCGRDDCTSLLCNYHNIDKWKGETFLRPRVNSKDNTITIKLVKDSWNREEVEGLFNKFRENFPLHRGIQIRDSDLDDWLERSL